MKLKHGDKVSFWQTIQGKPTLRTGIFKGYHPFNGRVAIQTGSGTEVYTHYIKPEKVIVLKENEQPELGLE